MAMKQAVPCSTFLREAISTPKLTLMTTKAMVNHTTDMVFGTSGIVLFWLAELVVHLLNLCEKVLASCSVRVSGEENLP